MKSEPFDYTLELDGEPVRVTGTIAPSFAAVGASESDPGSPAEGGEIEDFKAFDEAGRELPDPDEVLSILEDEIRERIEKDAEAAEADDADARNDREIDA